MQTPLYTRLINYHSQNRISFAMPGHKNGVGLVSELINCDVTELSKTEDLFHAGEYTQKSLDLLAKTYRAQKSFILTSGSTTAIHTMLLSVLNSGDTLLASADCHMSVVNICALMGIKIRILPKEYKNNLPTKTVGIAKMLKECPDIKACIITSPNYYGVCSDVEDIAKECHKCGIPLIVDEAHGAHFIASDKLPKTAIELGADMSCQSAHKTLNALTGAAYLHINSNLVSPKRVEKTLLMLHSSSPSYMIASSADVARAQLECGNMWDSTIKICEEFKVLIQNTTDIEFLANDDKTRLVLCFDKYNISGFEVSKILCEEYGIDIEMATMNAIVLIVSASNTKDELQKLAIALSKILKTIPKSENNTLLINIEHSEEILPHIAYRSKTKEVNIQDCAGEMCASTITIYPPGIPVLYAGEIIKKEVIDYIKENKEKGALITGVNDGLISVCERI